MKLLPPPRLALLLVALCAGLPLAARAQTTVLPDNGNATPAATPRPRPRSTPKPPPDPSQPVATVNGEAVYRPLFKSEVTDPVNRTLILMDFAAKGLKVSTQQVDEAVENDKRARFGGSDAKLDAKLQSLGATRPNYRQFVAEETRLKAMLYTASRGGEQSRAAYVAGLRARAKINTPRG